MAQAKPTATETARGSPAWLYVGRDERNRELEIIAVEDDDGDPALLVFHGMPTQLRGGTNHD